MTNVAVPTPDDNLRRFVDDFTDHMRRNGHDRPQVVEAMASMRRRFAEGRRILFAAGRIGPTRRTDTGVTLRLVTVIGTAGLRITDVQPPERPRAA